MIPSHLPILVVKTHKGHDELLKNTWEPSTGPLLARQPWCRTYDARIDGPTTGSTTPAAGFFNRLGD